MCLASSPSRPDLLRGPSRPTQAVRFIQLDHAQALQEWNATGQDRAADFCDGHPASMESMYQCFLELLAELRAQDADKMVVVLWAVDQAPVCPPVLSLFARARVVSVAAEMPFADHLGPAAQNRVAPQRVPRPHPSRRRSWRRRE